MERIGVAIVDDHPLFCQGLRDILESEADIYVMSECRDGVEALRQITILQPEVAIIDINMPHLNGIQVCRRLRSSRRKTAVILLTAYDDVEQVLHSYRAGAAAYCSKNVRPEELVETVRQVARGYYVVGDDVYDEAGIHRWLEKQVTKPERPAPGQQELLSPLSTREMEILQHVTRGLSNKEIASYLGISHQTVKNHMTAILNKLDVEDRTQAAVYALRYGWVRLQETGDPMGSV